MADSDETFVRSYQEEEFLSDFGQTPVLPAVLGALKPLVWEPNPSCNDDVRRRQKLETDPDRLKLPVFRIASTYARNEEVSVVQVVFESADHAAVIRATLDTGRWETERIEHPLWRVNWVNIDPALQEKMLGDLKDFGIEPEAHELLMLSESGPTLIELLGHLATWKAILGAGAALYAKKYLDLLAADHFASRKKVYAAVRKAVGGSAEKLQRFVKLLLDNCKASERPVGVSIKFPTERFRFHLPLEDEDEAIATLARMTNQLGMVAAATGDLKDRIKFNMPATVTLDDDGFTLTWWDEQSWSAVAQKYGADGKPVGETKKVEKSE